LPHSAAAQLLALECRVLCHPDSVAAELLTLHLLDAVRAKLLTLEPTALSLLNPACA
jgi:hypothetical protein